MVTRGMVYYCYTHISDFTRQLAQATFWTLMSNSRCRKPMIWMEFIILLLLPAFLMTSPNPFTKRSAVVALGLLNIAWSEGAASKMALKIPSPAAIFDGYTAKKSDHVCCAASTKSWGLSVHQDERHRHRQRDMFQLHSTQFHHIYIHRTSSRPIYQST